MIFRLSGNPPFYDETEEENTDMHNRIIFCRIVGGEFEFDSPYWDDISPAGIKIGKWDVPNFVNTSNDSWYFKMNLFFVMWHSKRAGVQIDGRWPDAEN